MEILWILKHHLLYHFIVRVDIDARLFVGDVFSHCLLMNPQTFAFGIAPSKIY